MTLPSKLANLTQAQLDTWATQAQTHAQNGQLPSYIPLLAEANLSWFAVQVRSIDGQIHTAGDYTAFFPLMSVTKSGVSGAIVSVVPSQGAIACYSKVVGCVTQDL